MRHTVCIGVQVDIVGIANVYRHKHAGTVMYALHAYIYIDVQVWIVDNTLAQVCIIVLQAYIITSDYTGYIAMIM